MYRPSLEKRTSEMEEIISEKKEREEASSSCSKTVEMQCTVSSIARKTTRKTTIHTFLVLIAQRPLSHIGKLNSPFRAGVHKPVAAGRVEFGGGDDLGELLHVGRLYINDVEALVLDVEIPQVDAKIVAADEGLPVAVHRDAVYVVRMGVGVRPPGHSGHNGIMVRHPRKLQHGRVLE
jgi:hypothetical protein